MAKRTRKLPSKQVHKRQQAELPAGIRLVRTLRGHERPIGRIAWSPNGRLLASPSNDKTIRLWDASTGECLQVLRNEEFVHLVAFSNDGKLLATGGRFGADGNFALTLWNLDNGQVLKRLGNHLSTISAVAFQPNGTSLASGSFDTSAKLWDIESGTQLNVFGTPAAGSRLPDDLIYDIAFDPTGRQLLIGGVRKIQIIDPITGERIRRLKGQGYATNIAFDSAGRWLASAGSDGAVHLRDTSSYKLLRTLEGHTDAVTCLRFLPNTDLLATRGREHDSTIRLWHAATGNALATFHELASDSCFPGIAFHPFQRLLATVGSDPDAAGQNRDRLIHIWELDVDRLLDPLEKSVHYVNAKVVLVGDTGVGKSGLSLVLNNEKFAPTESTAGRRVWTFDTQRVKVENEVTQTRETLLWDLAGQPGYRIIHQLHLNEVAVAIVVFDARSETDPLAGVRHWERALRLAQQRQRSASVAMKKFLVSARNDRGGVSVSKDRINALRSEFEFDGYFETSAKEGWEIETLREAIQNAIDWGNLPEVSSSELFAKIKDFLLEVKKSGRMLSPASQLFDEFNKSGDVASDDLTILKNQFDTCIGRLENRDLIRRLTFGGYVLLQPELLDAYASAMVNTAKSEPDGLGSLGEDVALAGKFFVPKEQKIQEPDQEQLLLHATVEELVRHDLALRENADDGRYLVFPSQFNRDYEDAPEPKGKALAISFDGPAQNLYSTLTVRLAHSGLFTTGRVDMWRNAALFTAKASGKCGLFLQEFAEGRGRLILFYDERASSETRFNFEEFVVTHVERRALNDSVAIVRFFICSNGHPVPHEYVKLLREQGKTVFACPCGEQVSLIETREPTQFQSAVSAMDQSADRHRDFDAFVMSAKGEVSTQNFKKWAGAERVTLAIVFTDIIGSTALNESIRDESMAPIIQSHFLQSRTLIKRFGGREIKTIGDSFMTAFKSADAALNYALSLHESTGHPEVKIRAGIHIGQMQVTEDDVFGGTVNFAARVVGAIEGAEIWLSERVKEDIDRLGSRQHKELVWQRHDSVTLKGFPDTFTLWSVRD